MSQKLRRSMPWRLVLFKTFRIISLKIMGLKTICRHSTIFQETFDAVARNVVRPIPITIIKILSHNSWIQHWTIFQTKRRAMPRLCVIQNDLYDLSENQIGILPHPCAFERSITWYKGLSSLLEKGSVAAFWTEGLIAGFLDFRVRSAKNGTKGAALEKLKVSLKFYQIIVLKMYQNCISRPVQTFKISQISTRTNRGIKW